MSQACGIGLLRSIIEVVESWGFNWLKLNSGKHTHKAWVTFGARKRRGLIEPPVKVLLFLGFLETGGS